MLRQVIAGCIAGLLLAGCGGSEEAISPAPTSAASSEAVDVAGQRADAAVTIASGAVADAEVDSENDVDRLFVGTAADGTTVPAFTALPSSEYITYTLKDPVRNIVTTRKLSMAGPDTNTEVGKRLMQNLLLSTTYTVCTEYAPWLITKWSNPAFKSLWHTAHSTGVRNYTEPLNVDLRLLQNWQLIYPMMKIVAQTAFLCKGDEWFPNEPFKAQLYGTLMTGLMDLVFKAAVDRLITENLTRYLATSGVSSADGALRRVIGDTKDDFKGVCKFDQVSLSNKKCRKSIVTDFLDLQLRIRPTFRDGYDGWFYFDVQMPVDEGRTDRKTVSYRLEYHTAETEEPIRIQFESYFGVWMDLGKVIPKAQRQFQAMWQNFDGHLFILAGEGDGRRIFYSASLDDYRAGIVRMIPTPTTRPPTGVAISDAYVFYADSQQNVRRCLIPCNDGAWELWLAGTSRKAWKISSATLIDKVSSLSTNWVYILSNRGEIWRKKANAARTDGWVKVLPHEERPQSVMQELMNSPWDGLWAGWTWRYQSNGVQLKREYRNMTAALSGSSFLGDMSDREGGSLGKVSGSVDGSDVFLTKSNPDGSAEVFHGERFVYTTGKSEIKGTWTKKDQWENILDQQNFTLVHLTPYYPRK